MNKVDTKEEQHTLTKNIMSSITTINVWITRISPGNKEAVKDFKRFEEELLLHGNGLWDKDSKNKMKLNDIWCTIIGTNGNQKVKVFKITKDLSHLPRPSHWKSTTPYSENNGINPVNHRGIIRLESLDVEPIEWNYFKNNVGWNFPGNNMPRGTTRIKNTTGLTFI